MSDTRLTVPEFTERCKALLDDPVRCACEKCSGQLLAGYGLAGGGGIGPYVFCMGCGEIVLKAVEAGADGEVFNP